MVYSFITSKQHGLWCCFYIWNVYNSWTKNFKAPHSSDGFSSFKSTTICLVQGPTLDGFGVVCCQCPHLSYNIRCRKREKYFDSLVHERKPTRQLVQWTSIHWSCKGRVRIRSGVSILLFFKSLLTMTIHLVLYCCSVRYRFLPVTQPIMRAFCAGWSTTATESNNQEFCGGTLDLIKLAPGKYMVDPYKGCK